MKISMIGLRYEVDALREHLEHWAVGVVVTSTAVARDGMTTLVSLDVEVAHQWMTLPERPDGPVRREVIRAALAGPDDPDAPPNQRRPRRMH